MASPTPVNRRRGRTISLSDREMEQMQEELLRESARRESSRLESPLSFSQFVRLRCIPGELSAQDTQEQPA